MSWTRRFRSILLSGSAAIVVSTSAAGRDFDIPKGDLGTALDAYALQSGVQLVYAADQVSGIATSGAKGSMDPDAALSRILAGTAFVVRHDESGAIAVVRGASHVQLAQVTPRSAPRPVAPTGGTIETVTVTAEKMSEDIQTVPIAVTAMTQKELTTKQIAGGPDLIKEVPNLTFSKTNFSGYNIEIRGIGTQAISVTTDPAVAVALNGIPFIRNHFFEQEFYDLSSAEVLRGPQGTLYGRNATAGVVNIMSAKPTEEFAAMASVDFGNYDNRRYEAMVNMPIVDDRLDIRVAGEWTKRDGYTTNTDNNSPIDGRDLWSSRVTIGWKPTSDVQAYLVWEHFSEDDNRMRTAKQLCETDPGLTSINGVPVPPAQNSVFNITSASFSQGCLPSSLYSKSAFEVPNGFSLPFISGAAYEGIINDKVDPYASTVQSRNLRNIQSAINPIYRAKNDTLELNTDWTINPSLTATSQTGFNRDMLWSSEDYNRFDTSPGVFVLNFAGYISPTGVFCDPQLGCSNRLVVQDLSREHAWQFSQEFRLASSYEGPFNFSVGGNYLHYETEEDYFVFANTFTMISRNNVGCSVQPWVPNVTNDLFCLSNGRSWFPRPLNNINSIPTESPQYIDPNPITQLDGQGHNYFVSQNPYALNSYAAFGEAYYQTTPDLKLTAGLRLNDDEKHFVEIPSRLLVEGYGYPPSGVQNQQWDEWTGRLVATWTPKLDFTDQSMFYGSLSRGYKAGGANPPGPVLLNVDTNNVGNGNNPNTSFPDHPLTFRPEFITAFEIGSKNTLFDDSLTLNGDIFYYIYKNYQISQIVDRSAINLNFNAHVDGAELEATWEPVPGLRFSFAGGYENTSLDHGSQAIDLMDRTAETPGWIVMKPSVGQSSNCILPTYVAAALVQGYPFEQGGNQGSAGTDACGSAYTANVDPITLLPYVPNPTISAGANLNNISGVYPGFNPASAPNNGEGFYKNLSGNSLPGAPPFTVSFTSEYTVPVSADWAATLHGDFYWQANSWARVENDRPYDVIHGYANVNLSLILNNADGLQVMGYVKNVFNTTATTGDFLNSDDSGLTTNVFLTDPRLFGVRVTKQFDGGAWPGGISFLPDLFANADGKAPPLWIEIGSNFALLDANQDPYDPPFIPLIPKTLPGLEVQQPPHTNFDYEAELSYIPDASDWVLMAGIRYGKSSSNRHIHKSLPLSPAVRLGTATSAVPIAPSYAKFVDNVSSETQTHLVLDFMAGKDVGIGSFTGAGTSILSGGVRYAEFTSTTLEQISSDPDYHYISGDKYHDVYNGTSKSQRSFHGIGPTLSLSGSEPILGTLQSGEINIDWGANAAVLFGRQRLNETHQTSQCHFNKGGQCPTPVYSHAGTIKRSRTVTVPNLGGFGGISVRYQNATVSFGYRADEYFGAMDGGYATAKSFNRGFFGPFANVSVGLGG